MEKIPKKKISVIIPTYNEEKKITSLLDIVKARGGDFLSEIIISDGGSTDRTNEVARLKGVTCIISPKKGRSYQLNYGAKIANGNILYFLHADTLPPQNFAELISNAVTTDHLAGSFGRRYDSNALFFKISSFVGSFHILNYPYGDHSLFIEKELFKKIRGYSDMNIMEDHEIIERIVKETRFTILPQQVTTSARKFKEQGIVRLHLIFLLITIMYKMGFKEQKLIDVYKYFIK